MSENPNDPNTNPPESGNQPEFMTRHEQRMQRRAERRAGRSGSGWIGGLILIAVGVILMLQNFGYAFVNLTNWWALFILIPAIGAFGAAWRSYQNEGRLNAGARGSLIGGLVMLLITAIFLFGLDWGILGPVVIILVGAGLLLNTLVPG